MKQASYNKPTRNALETRVRDLERYVEHLTREVTKLKSAFGDLRSEAARRGNNGERDRQEETT